MPSVIIKSASMSFFSCLSSGAAGFLLPAIRSPPDANRGVLGNENNARSRVTASQLIERRTSKYHRLPPKIMKQAHSDRESRPR